ncbi:MAG: DUF975 family protein [Atopobiaceae bacterium]|jgi:uncharacterized membrane protein
MWTRAELKERAKVSFKRNYWKSVFIAFIMAFAVSGYNVAGPLGSALGAATSSAASYEDEPGIEATYEAEPDSDMPEDTVAVAATDAPAEDVIEYSSIDAALIGSAIVALIIIVLLALAISLVIAAFIALPLHVGSLRFSILNLEKPAKVQEVMAAFDNSYLNVVKTMVIYELRLVGWTLLFIIPGIYKAYEYRMVPYLMAEHPGMSYQDAFDQSRSLMDGNKWQAFVLDLSFIGWEILSGLTLGILEVFYVAPYRMQTNAALYTKLTGRDEPPALPLYAKDEPSVLEDSPLDPRVN